VHVVIEIRAMDASDWPAVEAIFGEGIATSAATFETEPPDYNSFDASHHAEHRYVAVEDGRVVGWVAIAPTSSRACYAGVAESSVYVAESARGRGVGRALMEAVVASAATGGIWTIQAGMFPENNASLALHESLGFRLVGRFERIAQLDGVWRDTVLLELRL
jgi:L-amino acid N-acyltransferase YncA